MGPFPVVFFLGAYVVSLREGGWGENQAGLTLLIQELWQQD